MNLYALQHAYMIVNRWPTCKRADPIVSRPAGLQAGQLAIAGQEAGCCGLKAGWARRTAVHFVPEDESWSGKRDTALYCITSS